MENVYYELPFVPIEVSGLLKSTLYKIQCSVGGKQVGGLREIQGEKGQLTSSKGPERMGICHHEQGIAFPSKNIFFLKQIHTGLSIMYMCAE
jgi:hypothetical protein